MPGNESAPSFTVERKAGEALFQQDDPAEAAYVLLAGELELTSTTADGSQAVARLGPGDVCGLLALLEGTRHALGARALTDARLVRLGPGDLGRVVAQPELAGQLLRALARQLEAALRPAAAPPATKRSTGPRPRLVAEESGLEFLLPAEGSALVGRGDTRSGFKPDLDLSALDTRRSLSRRHARLLRRDETWLVSEEPRAANGTFVNGQRLTPGQARELHDGDELLFGNVRARFRES